LCQRSGAGDGGENFHAGSITQSPAIRE
jgi:hypothetical protein